MNELTIYTFASRKKPIGQRCDLTWDEFKERLRDPVVTSESRSEYASMTNEQRTEIKDVGGYVAGVLLHGRRGKSTLVNRCIATIDADDASPDDWATFNALMDICAVCHTTHTSTPDKLRLRWLFPLSRPVSADEYTVIVQELCKYVGVNSHDDSTDQPERLMFWPSVSRDAEYQFWENNYAVLDVDALLGAIGFVASEPAPAKELSVTNGVLNVGEGNRNKTVFSFAASLRSQGLDYNGIRDMLESYNDRYCGPPLEAEELDTICRSVCTRYDAGEAVLPSLRDAWDDFQDMGECVEKPAEPIRKLAAESLASLGSRHVEAPTYVVDDLIANGITILASPPKFGKSWMCMDLAISVAGGTDFMGIHTNKKGVVYMALEDGDYRLQDRGRKVADGRSLPDNLYLIKDAPVLQDGLLPMLTSLLNTCENVGMVIIDTLQKVRGVAKKTEGVYGYDYRELGQLHSYALDHGLAVVLVHHLNKGGDDGDFVGRLNGSTGISGAADSIITLSRVKRGDKDTKMSITGRDVKERTLVLQMDWGHYRWMVLGEEHEVAAMKDELEFTDDPLIKTIIYHLDEADELADDEIETSVWACTSAELLAAVEQLYGKSDLSPTSAGRKLVGYTERLRSQLGIEYEYRRRTNRREHVFTREII